MAEPTNLAGVRAARAGAKPVGKPASAPPPTDDAGTSESMLPEGCPVVPLGTDENVRYYLNADRQMIALSVRDHSRLGILGLFGQRSQLLYDFWPRHDKTGSVTGWRPELASESLMAACSAAGVWDAAERMRGRGAWLGADGELILHLGKTVMTFPRRPDPWGEQSAVPAGLVGRHVYSAGAPLGAPSAEAVDGGPDGPGAILLDLLRTWRWRRGESDAMLLLGWIGAAMIGGALDWRPMVWLTGGKGTGKSTLQDVLRGVFGGGMIQTADTTAAGLWQAIKHQTLPVGIDELEAEEDNRRAIAVVKLARLAASGGLMLRGGQDHKGTEFVLRSAMLFSSILIPPLTPQDRSRITVLELDDLVQGAAKPKLDAKALTLLGARLRRRMVDGWHRLEPTLALYRQALQDEGHTARSAEQLSALLACAEILLHDASSPRAGINAGLIKQLTLFSAEDADEQARDEDRCLMHLMSRTIDVYRQGGRRSLGEWVQIAADLHPDRNLEASEGVRVLSQVGLKLMPLEPGQMRMVAVANYHSGLSELFATSHWAGKANTMGVWVQALRRLRGAKPSGKAIWFAGMTGKGTLVPLELMVPRDQAAPRLVPLDTPE